MKNILFAGLTIATLGLGSISAEAATDPLSVLKQAGLNDVKQAEAIYAANPTVPTYKAATQCLGYLDTTLSNATPGTVVGSLMVPKGIVSTIADLDVAVNTANGGLSSAVIDFNANCGGYIEDLKAEVANTVVTGGINIFGLKL